MKYLMTEGLLTEDFDRFVEAHDAGDDFVDEYSLRDFAESFGEYTAQQAAERGFGVNKGILDDGIVQGLIADIDVIVCYPDDAKGYRRFGKKNHHRGKLGRKFLSASKKWFQGHEEE